MLTEDVTPLMEANGRYDTDTLPVPAKRLKPSDEMDAIPSKSSGSGYGRANEQINPPVDPWADICPCLIKCNDVDDDVWQTSLEDQVDPITSPTAKNIVERNRTEIQRWQVPHLCTPEC